jgi:anti-sigma-K factor RskA
MTHAEVRELLGAYAAGAVDAEERREIERHLPQCRECRDAAAELLRAASYLAEAVPERDLPADLWPRLHLMMRREGEPGAFASRGKRGVLVLATLVLLALGGGVAWEGVQIRRLQQEVEATRAILLLEQNVMSRVLPGTTIVELRPTAAAQQARGIAVVRHEDGGSTLVLLVAGLPPVPPPSVYQAWLVKDGARTSAGVVRVGRDGVGILQYRVPQGLHGYQGLGVTREPQGPAEAPRGPRVLGASL